MNLKLTLIFVAICSIGFAQDIAKKNQFTYDQWSVLKLINDSLETVLSKKVITLNNEISTARSNINGTLQALNYSIEEENYHCNVLMDSLRMLAVDISSLGSKPKALTNYYSLCADLKAFFASPTQVVSTRQKGLNEPLPTKTADQGAVLTQRLADERLLNEQINAELIRVDKEIKEVMLFNKDSRNLLTLYSDQLANLKLYKESLQLKKSEKNVVNSKPVSQDKPVQHAPKVNVEANAQEVATQDELSSSITVPEVEQQVDIYEVVEEDAQFPGGQTAMMKYLQSNLHYPDFALDKGLGGRCYVRFVISDQGVVSNVRISRGVPFCEECDAEAVRVVRAMPNWIPGKNKGKPVSMWYNLPIKYTPN